MASGVAIALALLTIACQTGRPSRGAETSRDQYLILASELEATRQTNLYDAVRQLRPFWFSRQPRSRGEEPGVVVYLDDQQIGPAAALSRIPIYMAARVRYLPPTEAHARFGPINGLRGAILVDSERP